MKKYDVIIIGSGVAGRTAASLCSDAGWSVAVAEKQELGGTCSLRGCDPKKVFVGVEEAVNRVESLAGHGIHGGCNIDWGNLVGFKKTFTEAVPEKIRADFESAGIDILEGKAAFSSENSIKLSGEEFEADYFLIATGSKEKKLDFPGSNHIRSSAQFMDLLRLPKDITFIGAGYISFEFAYLAAAAGSKTRMLEAGSEALPYFDRDLMQILIDDTLEKGIEILFNIEVLSVNKEDTHYIIDYMINGKKKSIETGLVIHGAGRLPSIEDLGLEHANINSEKGRIKINSYLQSISNPRVYVAGDACGIGPQLTPVANLQAIACARNILDKNHIEPEYKIIPSTLFTNPPLSSVGITEKEARSRDLKFTANFHNTTTWYNSRRIGLKNSAFKVLIEDKTGRILGAHILGDRSEEAINIFALAMRQDICAGRLKCIPWSYPSAVYDIGYML